MREQEEAGGASDTEADLTPRRGEVRGRRA